MKGVRRGDTILVRMVVNNLIEGSDAVQCRVHNPKSNLYAFVPVAPSEIVSIEKQEAAELSPTLSLPKFELPNGWLDDFPASRR